jgi:hypothetical protein
MLTMAGMTFFSMGAMLLSTGVTAKLVSAKKIAARKAR